ncbi:MAG TPA: hypothetical protein VK158_02175 [Acidobacteriota bacterium]|nr:hypothetical protein [Acidobacteriota bacterium]
MGLYEIDTLKDSLKKYAAVAIACTSLGLTIPMIYHYATRSHMQNIQRTMDRSRSESLYRKNLREYERQQETRPTHER